MELIDLKWEWKHFGLLRTLADLSARSVSRAFHVRVLKALQIERVDPGYLEGRCAYKGCFLDAAQLAKFTRPEYEMSDEFVAKASANGDECYAFLDGGVLVSYGWYSRRPTPIDPPGLLLHFDPDYVYMYKGFTLPQYRGQRLHAIGMTRALQSYLARGYKGLVSYVEWNNLRSLRSCYRMGYFGFGNLYVLKFRGCCVAWASAGCRRRHFALQPDTGE